MGPQELLGKVKAILMLTGNDLDAALLPNVLGAKGYMLNAGVREDVIFSDAGISALAIGANDMWNLSAGGARFSPIFMNMVVQLRLATSPDIREVVTKAFLVVDRSTGMLAVCRSSGKLAVVRKEMCA